MIYILLTIVSIIYTIYLGFIIYNPARREASIARLKKKITKDHPTYTARLGTRSPDYFKAWLLISIYFVLVIAFHILEAIGTSYTTTILIADLTITTATLFIGLYFMGKAIKTGGGKE